MDLVNEHFIFSIISSRDWRKNHWNISLWIILRIIGKHVDILRETKVVFRILKDPCGGKVFPNRADYKHSRQMFNSQKEIMQRVGFTKEVLNKFHSRRD